MCEKISPESDYEQWENMLITERFSSNTFHLLLTQFCKMAKRILEFGELKGKLKEKTDHFINTNIPEFIKRISQCDPEDNKEMIYEILKICSKLIIIFIRKGDAKLATTLITCYSPRRAVYFDGDLNLQKLMKLNNWKKIMTSFVEECCGIEHIFSFIYNNQDNIDISVYNVVFSLLWVFRSMQITPDLQNYVYCGFNKFISWLSTNQKAINTSRKEIEYVLDLSIPYVMRLQPGQQCFNSLLNVALENIRGDSIDKNYIGLVIVQKIMNTSNAMTNDDYNELIKSLLSKSFHQQIISEMTPILVNLVRKDLITIKILLDLWNKMKNAHFSIQGPYIDLMSEVLANIKTEVLLQIPLLEKQSDENEKQILNRILVKTMFLTDGQVENSIMNYLLNKFNDEESGKTIYNEIINNKNKKNIVRHFPEISYYYINNPNKQISELLVFCLQEDKVMIPHQVFEAFINVAVSKTIKAANAYEVIESSLKTGSVYLTKNLIHTLFSNQNEGLWHILYTLIEDNGFRAFPEEGSISLIINYITEMKEFPKDKTFIFLVKDIMIMEGLKNGSVVALGKTTTVPRKYRISNILNLPLRDVFFNMYEQNPDELQDSFINILFAGDQSQVPKICDLIMYKIKTAMTIDQREVYIELLTKYCMKQENSVSLFQEGYARHTDSLIPTEKRALLTIHEPTRDKYYVILNNREEKLTVQQLIWKAWAYYSIGGSKSKLKIDNNQLPLNRGIDFSQFECSLFTLTDAAEVVEPKKTEIPSIYLYNAEFTKIFMDILDNGNATEREKQYIMIMLQKLPNYSVITQSINNCMQEFVNFINISKEAYLTRYTIECFVMFSFNSEFMISFEDANGVEALIRKIKDHNFISSIGPVCTILSNATPTKLLSHTSDLLNLLFTNFLSLDSISKSEALALMGKLDKEASASFVSSNIELTKTMFQEKLQKNNEQFNEFLLSLNIPDQLLKMCSTELLNKETAGKFMPIFASSIMKTKSNSIEYLDACFNAAMNGISSEYIGKAISKLLPLAMELQKGKFTTYIKKLLDLSINSDPQLRKVLLEALYPLESNEEITPLITEFIDKMSSRFAPRFGYCPSDDVKSKYGVGIKNLGSICYMISIFQQLSHLTPFLIQFLKEHVDSDSLERLKFLLIALHLSNKQSVDPTEFCNLWTDYGDELVRVGEQKDAMEFWTLLMERLPESVKKLFTGRVKNVLSSPYEEPTVRYEDFQTIPLNVIDCPTLDESLKQFLLPEAIESYNKRLGKIVEVSKTSRIEELPPVLVIQLKRFDYSIKNGLTQTKINTPLRFPESFDIRPIMAEECDTPQIYNLNGAVIHCGTVNSGHYYSIIKETTNEGKMWIKFNDSDVSLIDQEKFFKEAAGTVTKSDSMADRTSAYLLFYTRDDFKFNVGDKEVSFSTKIDVKEYADPSIVSDIIADNKEYAYDQCAFSEPMTRIALRYANPAAFVKFFIRIFCYSKYEVLAPQVDDKLLLITSQTKDGAAIISKCLVDEFSHVIKIITKCSIRAITQTLLNVISRISLSEDSEIFIRKVIEYLGQPSQSWSSILNLSQIILSYLEKSEANVQRIVSSDDLVNTIVDATINVYMNHQDAFLKNVDTRPLFKSIQLLATVKTNENMKKLMNIEDKVALSRDNLTEYYSMTGIIYSQINSIIDAINTNQSIVVADFYSCAKVNVENNKKIAKAIKEGNEGVRMCVIKNIKFFMNFIISDDEAVQQSCLEIIVSLFSKFPDLNHPSYVDSREYGDECNITLKTLIKIAAGSNNPAVKYSNICCAIKWILLCSCEIVDSLKDLVNFGLFLSSLTQDRTICYEILPAIEFLAKSQIEKELISKFFAEKEYKKTKADEVKLFLQMVTIIFFNNMPLDEKILIIKRPLMQYKVSLIQRQSFKQCFSYIYDFLRSLIDIHNRENDVSVIIGTVMFGTIESPVTYHIQKTYNILPEIANIINKNMLQLKLKRTLLYFIKQKGVLYDQQIAALLRIYTPPIESNFFSEEEYSTFFNQVRDKSDTVKLSFASTICSIMHENGKDSPFYSKMLKLIDSHNFIFMNALLCLYDDNEETAIEILSRQEQKDQALLFNVFAKNIKLIKPEKCQAIAEKYLKFASYETDSRSNTWCYIINNIDPTRMSAILDSIFASFNENIIPTLAGRIETILKLHEKYGLLADDIQARCKGVNQRTLDSLKNNPLCKNFVL